VRRWHASLPTSVSGGLLINEERLPPVISRSRGGDLPPNSIALGFRNNPIVVDVAGHLIRDNHDNAYVVKSPDRLADEPWGTGATCFDS
jgi:hypothetical protein